MLLLLSSAIAHSQTIVTPPRDQAVAVGESVTLSVEATGAAPLTYSWLHNGVPLAGEVGNNLTIEGAQPADAGAYTVVVASGASTTSAVAVLGLTSTAKVTGTGIEVGADIHHPNGNIFDQLLLQGTAATITADPGQVTRISYVDLSDDIVQVEFAGAGALTLLLDNASGPAPPLNYNQPTVSYVKGHGSVVIAGADETTNVSVFSVGRANAVNQALFREVSYDGFADIGFLAVIGGNGKFGGIRTANANYLATRGLTGVFAPGVTFSGPLFVGDISAFDAATPVLRVAGASNSRITGGDLLQPNNQLVQVSGLARLRFTDGSSSHGTLLAAQLPVGRLEQDGVDVTNQIAGASPSATLYVARLRADSAAATSTGSGYATVIANPNGTVSISVTFSNLTSPQVSAYLRVGATGDDVLNLPAGQVSDRPWAFAGSGTHTSSDLIYALNTGNIFVVLNSARFPGGELRGNFVPATGSQTFVAPAAPPPLAAEALTQPSPAEAARFLTQATFGPTSAEIDALMSTGITKWIDEQLAAPMSSHLAGLRADGAEFPNPPVPPTTLGEAFHKYTNYNRYAVWWKTTLTGPDQLRQRVAFALSQIFVASDFDSLILTRQEALAKYNDTLVRHAFGNFRQLLEEVTLDPVMGWWLSHIRNQKADPVRGTAPDENYAREVQQLFTIGLVQLQPDGTLLLDAKGQPIPTYDQEIVSETAKVFTGWGFANVNDFGGSPPNTGETGTPDTDGWMNPMAYSDAYHDRTEKRVVSLEQVPLDRAQRTVIPADQPGPEDLKLMLDTLFNHPNTGPFICRQLIQRLVTSNPSPGYVYRVAQSFANNGAGTRGDLGAVIRAILTDYEARSPDVIDNLGFGKIKEPLLRWTALLRVTRARAPNGRFLDSYFGDPRGNGWKPSSSLLFSLYNSGQAPLSATTVFNFFSPYYSVPGPLAAAGLTAPELEITDSYYSTALPNVMLSFLTRTGPRTTSPPAPSPSPYMMPDFAEFLPLVDDPAALVQKLNVLFCAGRMRATTRAEIENAVKAVTRYGATTAVQTGIFLAAASSDAAIQR